VKRAGRDKIEPVPDRVIVLKNAGAPAQAADEANFRSKFAAFASVRDLAKGWAELGLGPRSAPVQIPDVPGSDPAELASLMAGCRKGAMI
jgi:hypothetical protein